MLCNLKIRCASSKIFTVQENVQMLQVRSEQLILKIEQKFVHKKWHNGRRNDAILVVRHK